MNLLAIDFSSLQRSAAVLTTGSEGGMVTGCWQAVSCQTGVRTSDALNLVESALQQAQVERERIEILAVGIGPGSYTGIRAAIALAQGWQAGRGVRILGVSSAECIAAQAQAEGLRGIIEVVIDAQRNEFYIAGYELGAEYYREIQSLRIAQPAEVQARREAGGMLVGPEVQPGIEGSRLIFPHAAMLGRLAVKRNDFLAGEKLEPIYLRETRFVKAPLPRHGFQ